MKLPIALFLCFLTVLVGKTYAASDKITICRPNNMVSALGYVADHKNFFKDEGLEVTFNTATNGKICIDELLANKADFAFGAEGPFTYIAFSKPDLRLIAQTSWVGETALFGRTDKGLDTEQNIKGKTIGYLPGTVSYLYLARLLDANNLTINDLKAIPLQPPAMPQALKGGVIDGFVMWEPWGNNALKLLPDQATRLYNPALYRYAGAIVIRGGMAQRPLAVEKFLRALIKAERYVLTHKDESIAFLSRAVKLDTDYLKRHWADYEFQIALDPSLVNLMQENARLIIRDDENFKGKEIPDYARMIDASFLKSVAPERVHK